MTAITDVAIPILSDRGTTAAVPRAARPPHAAALALLLAALVVPMVPILLWSVARGWFYPAVMPAQWTTAVWASAFSPASDLARALASSLAISTAATVLAMILGVPAGRALGGARFAGKRAVEALVLAPILVPGLAVAMGLHTLLIKIGLAGTLPGVVLVQLVPTVPYVILVSAAVFARLDPGYEVQARLLGASAGRAMWTVTLPMVAPGLAMAAAFAFLVSWSQYALTLLVGGGRVVTLPLVLGQSIAAGRNDLAAVAAVMTILPGLVVLAVTAWFAAGRGGRS